MSLTARRVRVKAFAKINLDLRVLHRRRDGYHELRTVYQTISLADRLEIEFRPARRTRIQVDSDIEIRDNLAGRAAIVALEAMRVKGEVRIGLEKRIPMGSGLGGGSSDAAAVLLALPALAGGAMAPEKLLRAASGLGSDVPLFLFGGTVLGVGRGEEVYPLPDTGRCRGLLVTPEIHVSTAEAYRALNRNLTMGAPEDTISSFQSYVWRGSVEAPGGRSRTGGSNDFEAVVFAGHPRLKQLKKTLLRLGARPALMTGSGSALYGIFRTREELKDALPHFQREKVFPFEFVSRAAYRAEWRRRLGALADEEAWPPKSRRADQDLTD